MLAAGTLDVVGDVPEPFTIRSPSAAVNGLLGTALGDDDIAALLEPIGFGCTHREGDDASSVTVPTNRPDVRPAPPGIDDVAEEVARTYGYSRIERHQPTLARARRADRPPAGAPAVRQVLVGLGAPRPGRRGSSTTRTTGGSAWCGQAVG